MNPQYIFWDGISSRPLDESIWHDCILTFDGDYISLTALWDHARSAGYDPVIIFACKANETAKEIFVNGEHHGAFTYVFLKVLKDDPQCALGELITQINAILKEMQVGQMAEVLCNAHFLTQPYLASQFTIISDACRSKGSGTLQIVNLPEMSVSKIFDGADDEIKQLYNSKDTMLLFFAGHGKQLNKSGVSALA